MRFVALLFVFTALAFGAIYEMPASFWQYLGEGSGAFGLILGVAVVFLASLFDEVLP